MKRVEWGFYHMVLRFKLELDNTKLMPKIGPSTRNPPAAKYPVVFLVTKTVTIIVGTLGYDICFRHAIYVIWID